MARDVNEGGRGINRGWRQWFGARRRPADTDTQSRPGRLESDTLNAAEYRVTHPIPPYPSTDVYPSMTFFPAKGD